MIIYVHSRFLESPRSHSRIDAICIFDCCSFIVSNLVNDFDLSTGYRINYLWLSTNTALRQLVTCGPTEFYFYMLMVFMLIRSICLKLSFECLLLYPCFHFIVDNVDIGVVVCGCLCLFSVNVWLESNWEGRKGLLCWFKLNGRVDNMWYGIVLSLN